MERTRIYRLDEQLQAASSACENGLSCAEALFAAYQDEPGVSENIIKDLLAVGNGRIGSRTETCAIIAGASDIIRCLCAAGELQDQKSINTAKTQERIEAIFRREYGGITCGQILRGREPQAGCCKMAVKDMILIIDQMLRKMDMGAAS